jgi:hypothetical protein
MRRRFQSLSLRDFVGATPQSGCQRHRNPPQIHKNRHQFNHSISRSISQGLEIPV